MYVSKRSVGLTSFANWKACAGAFRKPMILSRISLADLAALITAIILAAKLNGSMVVH